MDETTFGFSRKVLDRAFVIEFSTVDLAALGGTDGETPATSNWAPATWRQPATSLANHPRRNEQVVRDIIEILSRVNGVLEAGQLQFGYRVRDEIVMFCLNAQECSEAFTTSEMGTVDPLDLAIAMKVLPRIQGAGTTIRKILDGLHAWASPPSSDDGTATGFPFCDERVNLMLTRLSESGFASYWL
jgi:hypothetical protein